MCQGYKNGSAEMWLLIHKMYIPQNFDENATLQWEILVKEKTTTSMKIKTWKPHNIDNCDRYTIGFKNTGRYQATKTKQKNRQAWIKNPVWRKTMPQEIGSKSPSDLITLEYDIEDFKQKLPIDIVTCDLCRNVLRRPLTVITCKHTFCYK